MIAAVIPYIVITLCNMAHIILAIYFFPSMVEFLDDLYWRFMHRSWFIVYDDETKSSSVKYINHSRCSILIDKAERYEKAQMRKNVVNYHFGENKSFDEYLRFRENQKMLQQASEDAVLIRKQNFRARVHERMVEQPVIEKKILARLR